MRSGLKKFLIALIAGFIIFFAHAPAYSQEMPPRPITVNLLQNLNFGAFYTGAAGGTVVIQPSGFRTSTGNIILVTLGFLYYPAIFGLQGNPGSIIHILNGPDAILTGSNGGSMTLHLGDSQPASPVILNMAPPSQTQIRIGGILVVGNPLVNPVGNYIGTFSIMFLQE